MAKRTDRIGAWAEHRAIAHFLNEGWDVFVSVTSASPFDLVLVKPSATRYIDVKYRRSRKPSGRKLSDKQLELKVELVHVMDTGNVIDVQCTDT